MRGLFALFLLVVLCAAANAAPAHQSHKGRHVVVRPTDGVTARGRPTDPGWGWRNIPPEENRNLDPSNFGGG